MTAVVFVRRKDGSEVAYGPYTEKAAAEFAFQLSAYDDAEEIEIISVVPLVSTP